MENQLLYLLVAPLLVGSIILGIHELLLVLVDFPGVVLPSVKLVAVVEVKVLGIELLKPLIGGTQIVDLSPVESRFLRNRLIADSLVSTLLFFLCCLRLLF